MYLVTEKTATKIISQDLWLDMFRAQIHRDAINAKTDEYSGAIIEAKFVNDLDHAHAKSIQVEETWNDLTSLSDIEFLLHLGNDRYLNLKVEVEFEIDNYYDVLFHIHIFEYEFQNCDSDENTIFTPADETKKEIQKFIKDYTDKHSTFDRFESEDIDEANRLSSMH